MPGSMIWVIVLLHGGFFQLVAAQMEWHGAGMEPIWNGNHVGSEFLSPGISLQPSLLQNNLKPLHFLLRVLRWV